MSTYNNILVAVDLTHDSRLVVSRAQEIAQQYGAALTLVHVVEPLVTMEDYELTPALPLEVEKTLEQRAGRFLETLAGEIPSGGAKTVVRIGAPKREILDFAGDNDIDLIVIGAHGRHGIATLLGSTANAVLHGTQCDVLCVRVGKKAQSPS
ncbi:MAG TPA: universal stress protein [Gammaproteobacteria bacterium]|nr:universal stress protein [Gammaproteobacteria bacterium]